MATPKEPKVGAMLGNAFSSADISDGVEAGCTASRALPTAVAAVPTFFINSKSTVSGALNMACSESMESMESMEFVLLGVTLIFESMAVFDIHVDLISLWKS
eukprot:CAMPEP_0116952796 /NCGR_PEP_ID=MMETSP0467-20121206/40960_1 /TAXON_ID=283647 /ORGANISM="Mesodinium pulex, Strain SPMC105" /LENGTH=101 /DNA_ID=CAMNT_0004638165 /DNA_START=730 /DNA_END=1035 /DNA_ORIENTATION=-